MNPESLIREQLNLLSYYSKLNQERLLKKKQDEEFQATLKLDQKKDSKSVLKVDCPSPHSRRKRKREILWAACDKRRKTQTQ